MAPAFAVDIEPFIRKSEFGDIEISPTGEYVAATVPLEDTTALVIVRLSDNKVTGGGSPGKYRHVSRMTWVNDDRLLYSVAEKMGLLDAPRETGEIYTARATDRRSDILVGQSLYAPELGSRITTGKRTEMVWAELVDALPGSENEVIIAVGGFGEDPYTRAERMHVVTGRRAPITRAPVRNGSYVTDNTGAVRAAWGANVDNSIKTYTRKDEGAEWVLFNDEASHGVSRIPLGFSPDNATLYLRSQRIAGTSIIEGLDMATGERSVVLADDGAEPEAILHDPVSGMPVGVRYMDGKPRTAFFEPGSAAERQYRSLEAAFPGHSVLVTSSTKDGRSVLVYAWSDRNSGDYFTFDTVAKKAAYVMSARSWHDPERMAAMRPVSLTARDGLPLAGYLTLPPGSEGRSLPTVVMPHGGPYGVFDRWGFDTDVQLLAAAGYAVLQVNYRGSGNHGRAFQEAGAREWGGKMQDDVTDATRWAIAEGIADPARICIHGGSYGGYAALMGVAKEPDLYRCASGYVGVYDLPEMQATTARDSRRLGNWSSEWVGSDAAKLAEASPNRFADRIKVPVLLAAGGEDRIAPVEHTKKMERALAKAGVPVEALYYPTEGHGFYVEANRRDYYTRLLAFLNLHLGGRTVAAASE
ncbi:alpha/beta hydrolase family protein [Luteimonas sp. A649]